jgi:predicted transcriptional regulator
MPRHPSPRPTDVELEILSVLWEQGPCTVRQVHDTLASQRDTGYSTTLKMMQVMKDKGLVTRDESVRPQSYRAVETRQQVELKMLDDLSSRVFGGSAAKLVMRMLSARRVSSDELAEMQRTIREARDKDP